MPIDNPKLLELTEVREFAAAAEIEFHDISAQLAQARNELEAAVRQDATARVEAARADVAQLEQNQRLAKEKMEEALAAVETRRDALLNPSIGGIAPPPVITFSADLPIILFPIRLETRFKISHQGPTHQETHLLIRIYPDDLHIDTHEPGLTGAEVEAGRRFWQQAWGPDGDEPAAWNQLVSRLGAPRAAWVAKKMTPINLSQQAVAGTNPEFPEPDRREAAWTRAPRAALLPDRWAALVYGAWGKLREVGKIIPEVLAAGPAPQLETAPPPHPELMDPMELMDEGMKWLMDFDRAVDVGMGIKVKLPPGANTDVTRLIVFGLKATIDPNAAGQSLGALLNAHHYTRSLGFIPRGMPTNNTGAVPSGYDSKDLGSERSFAAERKAPLFTPKNPSALSEDRVNGDSAARAFGVDPDVFAHVWRADGAEQAAARSMNAALWAATWGYFLTRRVAGTLTPDALASFRRHFIDYVRGGGPLPSLRIGNQPYGLLPVTSLEFWKPTDDDDVSDRAAKVLQSVREAFRRALAQGKVPRVNKENPDQSLLTVLRQSANSSGYNLRHFLGPQFVHNYQSFVGTHLNKHWWMAQQHMAATSVSIPGMPAVTVQGASLGEPEAGVVRSALVQFSPSAANATLKPNYISPLPGATIAALKADGVLPSDLFPSNERPLLYRILRHSLLLDYADAARRIRVRVGATSASKNPEPELIDINHGPPAETVWRQLDNPAMPNTPKLSTVLEDIANEGQLDVLDLAETRKALRTLANLTVGELELLLPETLDTCSHRFDAWATSLATKRLDWLRTRNPRGAYVGGYGWVEDLTQTTGSRVSEGFLHAPSMAHATTGAVLASAYLSHRKQTSADPFIIDMSSDRVRVARQLIRGVRQGQPLAALLGYRIERALQEQALQRYIAKFRKIAPLGGITQSPDMPVETVAANNVVNGLRILEMRQNNHPDYKALWTPVNTADHAKVDAILKNIENARDALGDVLMAEKVYQAARGNFSRAGYTVEDIAHGQLVSEPEVLNTPRTGTAVSHRVMFFCDENAPQLAAWNSQIRAVAEPRLNALASQLLPDPTKVCCRAQYLHPENGEPIPLDNGALFRELPLSALGLSPLDAVYVSSSRKPGERGEFEQRLEFTLINTRPNGVPQEARVRLNYSRNPTWSDDVLSFGQFQLIAAGVRRLLTLSRALTPGDLGIPSEPQAADFDLDEFSRRADTVAKALRDLNEPLTALVANAETAPLKDVRDVLMRCAFLGIKTAVPVSAVGESEEHRALLAAQARSVLSDVLAAVKKLDETEAQPAARPERDLKRIRSVLGSDFQAVPRVIANDPAELKAAFRASTELQGGDATAAGAWLRRAARVREPLNALGDALRNAEVMLSWSVPTTVAQLPFAPGDGWAALPSTDGGPLPGGRVSIVACGPVNLAAGQPVNAIVVDEWTEMVPSARETTGVAFHFDQPGARPPQAVLVAVAPDSTKSWNSEIMESVLLETLELSKLRAVDQDTMVELDHYLPALYFALNAADDTVTTNLGAA